MVKNKLKILFVDDSKFVLKYYKHNLELYGFDIHTALSAKEGLELLNKHQFDCILLDYEMPEMNGPELCQEIKSIDKFREIPVIMLTGNDDKKYLMAAIDAGADDFISKKVDLEIVSYKINAAIRFMHLLRKTIELERFRTTHAMITAIKHEINNPLMVAFGMLGSNIEQLDEHRYEKTKGALNRIHSVVERIDEMTAVDIAFEEYSEKTDMLKIK